MSPGPRNFIARQPILDARGEVFAYELLHRSGMTGGYSANDPTRATVEVLNTSMLVSRLEELTDHRLAFINVPEDLLVRDFINVLPTSSTVVEVLETVRPSPRVVAAVRSLKAAGLRIALDDFEGRQDWAPLVELADFVKVDFVAQDGPARGEIVERWSRDGLTFLAEKVETHADHRQALDLGYSLFQGYYFCRPETSVHRDLPRHKVNHVLFLKALARSDLDLEEIETVIKRELSLSAKLLRYLNSAHFGVREEIHSIHQALVHIGRAPLRRWGTLIALTGLGEDKPQELVRLSLVRAYFCEQLAGRLGEDEAALDLFLTGMFSALDALLDRPIGEALSELGVKPQIARAIEGDDSVLGRAYSMAQACESGDWHLFEAIAKQFGLPVDEVGELYAQAIVWTDRVFELDSEAGGSRA